MAVPVVGGGNAVPVQPAGVAVAICWRREWLAIRPRTHVQEVLAGDHPRHRPRRVQHLIMPPTMPAVNATATNATAMKRSRTAKSPTVLPEEKERRTRRCGKCNRMEQAKRPLQTSRCVVAVGCCAPPGGAAPCSQRAGTSGAATVAPAMCKAPRRGCQTTARGRSAGEQICDGKHRRARQEVLGKRWPKWQEEEDVSALARSPPPPQIPSTSARLAGWAHLDEVWGRLEVPGQVDVVGCAGQSRSNGVRKPVQRPVKGQAKEPAQGGRGGLSAK